MSKLNQIQTELQGIDGGKFQKLCDLYLMQNPRYADLKSIGAVIGKDKTKTGVPDSIITLPDGTSAFAHYTTEGSGLIGKLKQDFEKSFDESHTGFPIDQISEIIFCHNGALSTGEELSLHQLGRDRGVVVKIYGLERISYDLFDKYPRLAEDHLHVKVDTGQIVSPKDFVSLYSKNSLSTRLDTAFHFREEELKAGLEALEASDLVLITGPAGVGKSRLMLEIGSIFSTDHDWNVLCVFNRGADIFQDLRTYFKRPGKHLILVDDANRLGGFSYILQLIHDQTESVRIKIVATVRDYAREKLIEQSRPFGGSRAISLTPFSDDQIRSLISKEEGILNFHFLDRITKIARGNPRLAMMAARLAVKHESLNSISDVTSLYDEYFGSVRQDLQDLGDEEVIKVAGIIAFFRVVDRTRHEVMDTIAEAFDIPPSRFWRIVEQLDRLEILDLHENEVVKFSDQVLATYLFYLAVFKRGSLDFSTLLERFFPSHKSYFIDAINPVINSLGAGIEEQVKQHVDLKWNALIEEKREDDLISLIQTFWFVKQTDTLLYIRDSIKELPVQEVDVHSLDFGKDSPLPVPLLDILGVFYGTKHSATALELVFAIFSKNPKSLGNVLRILKTSFGFRPNSSLLDFRPQRQVIDLLWSRTQDGTDLLFTKLFLAVAEHYLRTHFDITEPKGNLTISIVQFDLQPAPLLHELRRTIWTHVLHLYSLAEWQGDVISLLHKHSHLGSWVSNKEILAKDAEVVIPFMMDHLNPDIVTHFSVVHDYLDLLDREGAPYPAAVKERFTTQLSSLADLLFRDRHFHRKGRTFEEEEARREEALRDYVQSFSVDDFNQLLGECLRIQQETPESDRWELQSSIGKIFRIVEERGPDFYRPVVITYLEMGAPFSYYVYGRQVVHTLVRLYGTETAHDIVSRDFPGRTRWLFDFYANIPPDEVNLEHLKQLYTLYDWAPAKDLPVDFEFLERYVTIDEQAITRVVETLLRRSEENIDFAFRLGFLFNPNAASSGKLLSYFEGELGLLKKAYLASRKAKDTSDHDGRVFNLILDQDPGFIQEHIGQLIEEAKSQGRSWLNWTDDRNLLFLWRRKDYEILIPSTIRFLFEKGQQEQMYLEDFLEAIFGDTHHMHGGAERAIDAELTRRQAAVLETLIQERAEDAEFMQFVFNVVGGLPDDHRRDLIGLFLQKNKAVDDFKRLSIGSLSGGWVGSAVPLYQSTLDFTESLLPLVEGLDYLDHRLYLDEKIEALRKQIEVEKKKDFMENA